MNNRYLPFELANMIADYHDYDKYCKPAHLNLLKEVLKDIKDMGAIMPENIKPRIAHDCWGNKPLWKYDWEPEEEVLDMWMDGWYN
jgi:hypothetical protein